MGILEFILGVLTLIVIAFISLIAICMHHDTKKLEEENKRLRGNKIKSEYKKVKDIGGQ